MVGLLRSGKMPRSEKKVPEKEIGLIESWIAAGAPAARPEPEEVPRGFFLTEEDRGFWAFRPIRRPPVPSLERGERIRTPVDVFVLAKLREEGLDFAADAAPSALIRRAYFDLLGLPPPPEEVDAFVRDASPDAYERLLDRLLDSPQYGERWGRHWLDAAGYADSNGFTEADTARPYAWRYRDYVIRSFNVDKPWDRFIVEQLAGDELAGATQACAAEKASDPRLAELLVATGFLRMAPDGTGEEVPDVNLARNQVVAETLKIVSSSLLGLTVGCAQCHDHRYDPLSQADYYRLRAVFEPAFDWKSWRRPSERLVSLYADEDRRKAAEIEGEARKLDEAAGKLRHDLLEKVFEREIAKVPESDRESARVARNTPRGQRTPEQKALLKKYPAADVQGALDLYDPEGQKKFLEAQAKAGKVRATKPPEPFLMALTEVAGRVPDTFLFNRGDHDQPRDRVEPGEPEVLRAGNAAGPELTAAVTALRSEQGLASSGRRLAYARRLVSGGNPLVARVLVNRFWLHHYGRGLVNTPGDFGRLGERPSHPELLDWLASEFMEGGWRLKPLHRLLMTSTVYRQSSTGESSSQADPENRLLGRWRLRRLEAEAIRDGILAVSGRLQLLPFGPPVAVARDPAGRVVVGAQKTDGNGDPVGVEAVGEQESRRSIYVEMRRTRPLTVLDTFDLPAMAPNCDARAVTTVAPQSLLLMNDVFLLAQANHLADRLRREAPGDARAQVARAWKLLYCRRPEEAEVLDCLAFLAEQAETLRTRAVSPADPRKGPAAPRDVGLEALASLCQVLLSGNRFLYLE
jgi:hypothetical protein